MQNRSIAEKIRCNWIIDRKNDLIWYIGSALAGWLYVGIILYAMYTTQNPLTDPLGTLRLGGVEIPLTLKLLVVWSWAFLIDSPHVWATLARTYFDPDEWQVRRRKLLIAWGWFLLGPVAITLPYLLGAALTPFGIKFSPFWLGFGALLFFVFFRLWAYYHVVRQHWGFFQYPITWALFLATIVGYSGWQWRRWQNGLPINGAKLLLMLAIVPLHFVAFAHPILAVFIVPLVTVGHNLQYHRIVWSYGQNNYGKEERSNFGIAKKIFSRFSLYILTGLLFTFALYQGPWIDFLRNTFGVQLDKSLLNSIAMMAGIIDPSKLNLGEKNFAATLAGWAMQHYYLDSKIWRVRRDAMVRKGLRVD